MALMRRLGRIVLVSLLVGGLGLTGLSLARVGPVRSQGRTIPVSGSVSPLAQAIAHPPHDRIIRLDPGEYGVLRLGPKTKGPLTFVSADPKRPAVFDSIVLNGIDGITLSHLTVRRRDESDLQTAPYLLSVVNASNVGIENVRITGSGAEERGREYGIFISGSQRVRVTGSEITKTRYGIGMLKNSHVEITGNELRSLQTDGIRGGGVSDLLIADNVLGNFTPKEREHPDGIQLWTNGEVEAARRITIRDNLIVRDGGGIIQGVFVSDTHSLLPFEDLTIKGNLAIGTMYNGVAVFGVRGGTIEQNEVVAYPDMRSYIRVERATDVTIAGNRAMKFLIDRKDVMPRGNQAIPSRPLGDRHAIALWLNARPALATRAGPYLRELAGRKP